MLVLADWMIWSIFALDLAVDLHFAPNRRDHARRHLVDVAIVVLSFPILPAVLALARLVRLVRAVRIIRLARVGVATIRGIPALKATLGRREVIYVTLVSSFIIFAGGAMTIIEPDTVKGDVQNAVWWAIASVITSKPANGDHFKTGQRDDVRDMVFYSFTGK